VKLIKPLLFFCLTSTPIIALAEAEADGGSTPAPALESALQAPAQKTPLKQPSVTTTKDSTQERLAMLYGDKGEFYKFDAELRQALKSGNAEKVAFLVSYPLTVYGPEWGKTSIEDAAALQQNYSKIFTKEVVDSVLNEDLKDLFSNTDGIRYFHDQMRQASIAVWALGEDAPVYKINSVYLPTDNEDAKAASNEPEIQFQCETKKHQIIIDYLPNKSYRYRSWNKPKSVNEKPNMELSDPKAYEPQGHGICGYDMWVFTTGDTKFRIDGAGGCGESTEPSKGYLQVLINDEEKLSLPCL